MLFLLLLYDLRVAVPERWLITHTAFITDKYSALGLQISNLPNFGKTRVSTIVQLHSTKSKG